MKSNLFTQRLLILVAALLLARTATLPIAGQQKQAAATEGSVTGPVEPVAPMTPLPSFGYDPMTLITTLPGYRANPLGHRYDTFGGLRPISIDMDFVEIKEGTFQMGCSLGDTKCESIEKPAHSVRITTSFAIGKYEVTQAQWQAVMANNPSVFKGDTRPVDSVSWNDAQDFLRKLNSAEDGHRYRLPTEAEWEYAARAGSTGSTPGTLDEIAWHGGEKSDRQTHPVGQKHANEWGLYDMQGNVWEWVQDSFGAYRADSAANLKGPASAGSRVLRGGSWNSYREFARVTYRSSLVPTLRTSSVGFRVARD